MTFSQVYCTAWNTCAQYMKQNKLVSDTYYMYTTSLLVFLLKKTMNFVFVFDFLSAFKYLHMRPVAAIVLEMEAWKALDILGFPRMPSSLKISTL